MSGTEGSAERGVGERHIPCPRCGHLNFPTDAVCLNCGADLDLARAQGVSPLAAAAPTASALPISNLVPAGGSDWRGPGIFLFWAASFCLTNLMVQVTGRRPWPLPMLNLFLGLEVIAGIVAVYEAVRVGSLASRWPLGPCRSRLAWTAVLILSLALAGTGLIFAFSETRPVNQLAAAGRMDLCPARITRTRWVSTRSGVHPWYRVDFIVGGRKFEDVVETSMLTPELGWAPTGQMERVPVAWLPQHPDVAYRVEA